NTTFLKCRVKSKTINDVKSMSLYSLTNNVPAYFIVCLINSTFISFYVDEFVNNTQTFQINDARQLPILIPDENTLEQFKKIFDLAIDVKKAHLNNKLSTICSEKELSKIQDQLDLMVNALYHMV